jgi:hypothetical protein
LLIASSLRILTSFATFSQKVLAVNPVLELTAPLPVLVVKLLQLASISCTMILRYLAGQTGNHRDFHAS